MKRLNVALKCWICSITRTIILSYNDSILFHAKAGCLGSIITEKHINLDAIIRKGIERIDIRNNTTIRNMRALVKPNTKR